VIRRAAEFRTRWSTVDNCHRQHAGRKTQPNITALYQDGFMVIELRYPHMTVREDWQRTETWLDTHMKEEEEPTAKSSTTGNFTFSISLSLRPMPSSKSGMTPKINQKCEVIYSSGLSDCSVIS